MSPTGTGNSDASSAIELSSAASSLPKLSIPSSSASLFKPDPSEAEKSADLKDAQSLVHEEDDWAFQQDHRNELYAKQEEQQERDARSGNTLATFQSAQSGEQDSRV